jgi:pimeloyl-ACP methyl ester carboxylesterase
MAIADERGNATGTGEAGTVTLPQGTLAYSEVGTGPPIVFVHGALVDGRLWERVTPLLAAEHRCVVPDLPLGSHRTPLSPDADLSPPGLAKLVADFLQALDLDGVTLVGNDTGGAICQLVALNHPDRLARLVLTPCDAYENFLPLAFRYLQVAARVPGGIAALMQTMRPRAMRRAPIAYGWLTKKRLPDELLDHWVEPVMSDAEVRRDVVKVLRGISKRYTLEAAERLRGFDRPALLAWAPEDRFFTLKYAQRLAGAFPDARLELIDDARTFVSLDQPERLGALIGEFAAAPAPSP